MLDPLVAAEIQTVRLKLVAFANRHSDQTVRSQCLAVDARLAEVLEGDDSILRQVLANSVEQLEDALRWRLARQSKRLRCIFLQGSAVAAVSRLKERGDPWRRRRQRPSRHRRDNALSSITLMQFDTNR